MLKAVCKCGVQLVLGATWTASAAKNEIQVCGACLAKRSQKWRAANLSTARETERRGRRKPRARFICARSNTKRRGLVWSLTFEEWDTVRQKPCRYCGATPEGQETGAWCDRLDCRVGYVAGNVAPCCWVCNTARSDNFTPEEMDRFIGPAIRAVREARKC